ncbi:MAG: phosphocholine cytidylyltransferase family protein [Phycisphaerales bacterium]|nr:phosphocholine cytidylyltransferase family protein [Phycisphaerales bacterium]
MQQALILAAGRGSRLGALLNGKPKGLLTIGGVSLIEHQIATLRACGISRIGVVVGHGAHYVRETIGGQVEFIDNHEYASTNSLYSLWVARRWIESGFMMVNSDLFADTRIYERVAAAKGSGLAYDSGSGADPEEMKVSLRGARVIGLSKSTPVGESAGESIGLLKFDEAAAHRLLIAADRIVRDGLMMEWAPAAVSAIASEVAIEAIDIAGMPWAEIDFPQDFEYATSSVWRRMKMRIPSEARPGVTVNGAGHLSDDAQIRNGVAGGRR